MKSIIASLIVVLVSFSAKAQLFYAQGGVNLANITSTNDGHTEKKQYSYKF